MSLVCGRKPDNLHIHRDNMHICANNGTQNLLAVRQHCHHLVIGNPHNQHVDIDLRPGVVCCCVLDLYLPWIESSPDTVYKTPGQGEAQLLIELSI